MPPALKSGRMPALIVIWLLFVFTVLMLTPMFLEVKAQPSDVMTQTLLMLLVAAVSFYIGTTQKSGEKDETIATALQSNPVPTGNVVATVDTSKTGPIDVHTVEK